MIVQWAFVSVILHLSGVPQSSVVGTISMPNVLMLLLPQIMQRNKVYYHSYVDDKESI